MTSFAEEKLNANNADNSFHQPEQNEDNHIQAFLKDGNRFVFTLPNVYTKSKNSIKFFMIT